jgi:hypothetical protein
VSFAAPQPSGPGDPISLGGHIGPWYRTSERCLSLLHRASDCRPGPKSAKKCPVDNPTSFVLVAITPALAQTHNPDTGTHDQKACSKQECANQTLSEKLDQTNGVVCTPDIDPGIKAPTPHTGKTPVIPPPGSPGGDQSVQPKQRLCIALSGVASATALPLPHAGSTTASRCGSRY